MSWDHEIAHRDPLNKRWYALCELATQLRARIIETDGGDTAAPTYEKADGSDSKTIAMSDFVGRPLRSTLLEDNIDVYRNAIMTKTTTYKCKWCNSDATAHYNDVSALLTAGSYGGSWIDHAEISTPDYWKQLYEAATTLRYLYYYFDDSIAINTKTFYSGSTGGIAHASATYAGAWANADAEWVATSGISAGQFPVGGRATCYLSSGLYVVSKDATVGANGAVYKTSYPDIADMYDEAAGTVLDSGWALFVSVTMVDSNGTSSPSFSGISFKHDYGTTAVTDTGSSQTFYDYANAGGNKVDYGDVYIDPNVPASTEYSILDSSGDSYGTSISFSCFPVSGGGLGASTIDKTRANYYLTDLGHPGDL